MVASSKAPGPVRGGVVGGAPYRVRVLVVNRKHPPVWLSRGMLESVSLADYGLSHVTDWGSLYHPLTIQLLHASAVLLNSASPLALPPNSKSRSARPEPTGLELSRRHVLGNATRRTPHRSFLSPSLSTILHVEPSDPRSVTVSHHDQHPGAPSRSVAGGGQGPVGRPPGAPLLPKHGGKPFKEGGRFSASRGTTAVRVPAALRLPVVQ